MAHEVTDEFGTEKKRYGVFTGAVADMEPDESVTVGISILDETHILTAEKTGYGNAFVQIYDTNGSALFAEEYDITEKKHDVRTAMANAVSTATERFLRLRTDKYSQVNSSNLPEFSG